jgi:hypothetical protein
MKDKNLSRFLLTFFLGWLGSFIINNTSLKPERHTSRTMAYLFLGYFTCGIYTLVAAVCNLTFDPTKDKNIGYICDSPLVETPQAPVADTVDPVDNAPELHATDIVENLYISDEAVTEVPAAEVVDDSKTVDDSMTADQSNS